MRVNCEDFARLYQTLLVFRVIKGHHIVKNVVFSIKITHFSLDFAFQSLTEMQSLDFARICQTEGQN